MRQLVQHQCWIVLAAAIVFFTALGSPRLWDDDESKNARCAQEMLARGDWVVPTFNFQLRTDKPVLEYWLMLASYSLFGVSEFAARFPSALLAVGTSLLTYHLGRRLFRPEVGFWAGLIMATNVWFAVVGRAATPDSTLIFCTTLALLAYVVGTGRGIASRSPARAGCEPYAWMLPRSWWAFAAMYAAMGLAVLAKGPVGVAVPVAAIGLFVLLSRPLSVSVPRPEFATLAGKTRYFADVALRRLKQCLFDLPAATWAMRPLTLASVVLAVALPWYALVGMRTHGAWLSGFFWRHNVERFMAPMEGHRGPIFYHLLALLVCFFPWSLFLPASVIGLARRIRQRDADAPACLLLAVWAGVWIGLFSVAGTKLPNYVLPAYPALAMMTGLWMADWVAAPRRAPLQWAVSAAWWILAACGIGVAAALEFLAPRWVSGTQAFSWIGLILVAGGAAGWWFQRRQRPGWSAASLAVAAVAMLATAFGLVAAPISQQQNGPQVGQFVHRDDAAPARVGAFRVCPPGMVFYVNQPIDDLSNPDAVRQFFNSAENRLLVTDQEGYKLVEPLLPADVAVLDCQRRFAKRGEVLVVGRQPSTGATIRAAATTSDPSIQVH